MITTNDSSSVSYDNLSISNYFITPYEKVLNILHKLKAKYLNLNDSKTEEELEYVIDIIQNKSLYSYTLDNIDNNLNKRHSNYDFFDVKENTEIKVIMDSLKEYSEPTKTKIDIGKTGNLFTRYAKERFKTTTPQKSSCEFFQRLGNKIDNISVCLDMTILNNESIVNEIKNNEVTVKDFENSSEQKIKRELVGAYLEGKG